MSTNNEDKDVKGRNWDQITGGTTSAATMGAGATGDIAATAEKKDSGQNVQSEQGGGSQQAGRTDDLLAGGSGEEQADVGFQGKSGEQGSQSAAGTGNRQAGTDAGRQGEPETTRRGKD